VLHQRVIQATIHAAALHANIGAAPPIAWCCLLPRINDKWCSTSHSSRHE
jgi:hypothetical protein